MGEELTLSSEPVGTGTPKTRDGYDTVEISKNLPLDARVKAAGSDGWLRQAVQAVHQVFYEWTIETDVLRWSGNATTALGIPDTEALGSGRGYAFITCPENIVSRYETVTGSGSVDEGEGVPFTIQYRIFPKGRNACEPIWVEDTGRWFAGRDGKPASVYGVLSNIEDRHNREQELNYLSHYDTLTGLMNRGRLAESLAESIECAQQHRMPCAFVLAAVDNLAMVNDAYGFDVADQVIAAVSKRLRSALRTGDSIGRYAGNKFGLILSNCSEQDVKVAADRLLRSVRDTVIETAAGPVSATVSIGSLALPADARGCDEAMVRAEEALDQAKSKHRDSYVAYKHSGKRESMRKRNIMFADEIISALNNRRLAIAFQPIVDAQSEQPALYECLLRLVKPDNEIVSAGHFIPVAEQLGLVRLIDHRVLELALDALADHPAARLSLNISGMTANDPRWLANLTAHLGLHRPIAERLTVEITETVALQDLEESTRFISKLRDLGCKVAIDDFGAGYTSFRNLKMLDVDMVKLDGSFCDQLCKNKDNQFFVRTLIDLAKNFKLETVAEWVQDRQDAELLRSFGVDYLQGFLYGAAAMDAPWASEQPDKDSKFAAL